MEEITHLLTYAASWRAVLIFVGMFCVAPYFVLWVVVRCWPPGDRREELLAEYWSAPWWRRHMYVGDVAIFSLLQGTAARARARRVRRRRGETIMLRVGVTIAEFALKGVSKDPHAMSELEALRVAVMLERERFFKESPSATDEDFGRSLQHSVRRLEGGTHRTRRGAQKHSMWIDIALPADLDSQKSVS